MARTKKSPTTATPKKKRFAGLRQIGTAVRQSRALDPSVVWWMLGAALLVVTVFVGIGLLIDHPVYMGFLGVLTAPLAALIIMNRRATAAGYRKLDGQPGAALAALSALRRGWFREEQPVAMEATRGNDPASAAVVYRAIGRPGVVLVLEGPAQRAQRLGEAERKRVTRVLPDVPVTLLRVGNGEGEVPLSKLVGKINRMRPSLSKAEVLAVNKRLRALGPARPPVPKGMDPLRARIDRKGMRGR